MTWSHSFFRHLHIGEGMLNWQCRRQLKLHSLLSSCCNSSSPSPPFFTIRCACHSAITVIINTASVFTTFTLRTPRCRRCLCPHFSFCGDRRLSLAREPYTWTTVTFAKVLLLCWCTRSVAPPPWSGTPP